MSQISFDATQVAPDTGMEPVPINKYPVILIDSELKPTKNGAGEIIAITMQITEGEFKGKNIKGSLNWRNQNETAQRIGHSQLSAICHAVGVMTPQDTVQLHNIPFSADVGISEDGKYNEVKAYMAYQPYDKSLEKEAPAVQQGFAGAAPPAFTPPAFSPPAPVMQQAQVPQSAPQTQQVQQPAFTQAPHVQQQAGIQQFAHTVGQSQPSSVADTVSTAMTTSHSNPPHSQPQGTVPPWIAAQQAQAQQG